MTAPALFQQLHVLGVTLVPHPDGTLHCRTPRGVLTPELADRIREHKAELHALVEAFEERAAIAEYAGHVPRAESERLAWALFQAPLEAD
jgi:hypothetical protein